LYEKVFLAEVRYGKNLHGFGFSRGEVIYEGKDVGVNFITGVSGMAWFWNMKIGRR
jgi:hypothetical protein